MKQNAVILFLLILPLYTVAQSNVSDKIIKKEGLYYLNDGLCTGVYLSHYTNGVVASKEGYFKGHPNGLWTWWWKNGQKKKEENYIYKNGCSYRDGFVYQWYENGKLMQKETYKDGLRHGKWYKYDKGGAVILKGTYRYGELISGDKVPVPVSCLRRMVPY